MSPAAEGFRSPSSSSAQRSYFQNPNPSVQKGPTDSGIFNTSFNPVNFSQLDFDCSKAAAAPPAVRPSRSKVVKVKKHVNSIGKTIDFVFNSSNTSLGKTVSGGDGVGVGEQQSIGESLDLNMLQFTMGTTDNSKSAKKMDSEEGQNSKFAFSERGAEKFGKLNVNGLEFVFGANMKNGVMKSNLSNIGREYGPDGVGLHVDEESKSNFTTEADSFLINSISSLNIGTGESGNVAPLMSDNPKTQENSTSDSKSSVNLDFAFSAVHRDVQTDVNYQKEESKEKLVSDGKLEMKLDANLVFGPSGNVGTSTEGLEKEDIRMSSTETNSGDGVNGNVDSGTMFGDSKVNGVFHIGNQNKKGFSCKGRKKLNKKMNNLKSEGAGACDYLKKQDNNIDSIHDGNGSFIFGSRLGNDFSDIHQSKVSSEKNSDEGRCYENQLKTEAELIKETVPSSSSFSTLDPGFVSKVHQSEAPPTNEAGITNNFSFPSKIGVFGTSFTGFNTPDINLASSFTSDMFSGLGKKLDFSITNSVGQRKLKKTKAKLRQQGRNHQQGGCKLSQEVPQLFEEASGCSPMDVSPYGGTECVSTSTDPATTQVKNENAVDTTENLCANNVSSSSATSFADVLARQQPHRKKYFIKTGQGVKCTTPKVSRAHESTSGKLTKDSDQEICDKWRKRGNQAYKKGDLSEAEACYSKGISSIQHIETSAFCTEPLLLCYSNRAAARMALGRLREGLKDCRTAAALDPTFVKANLRSANCHLLLGELEDASYNYSKCLESENIVCLDRRLAIDAADGLQKTQRVSNYLKQSAELLQQKTYESATTALGIISDALSLSCYSEKLLNMKGEALLVLGKHKDVVQLCEQTLDSAEKNFATESKLWRWNLMSKSYFHLGRLEIALDFIEKHEQLRLTADKSVDPKESLNPLAVTIRELLHCKNAGNEAFQNGKHTEAIEHYSAAISKSMESHSFAAVCFCNRAAARQSLGEIIDAIGDCSTAIALDATYPKALSRRSTLWEMIRDYKHAADDLQRLISILETLSGENSKKSNGSVKDLRKARRRLSSIEENSKKERSLDLYLILGIKPSDAAAEVKKAYRKAALRHHPDKAGQVIARAESGSDGQKWKVITESVQMDADKLFKMIGEAYAVLSDTTKRSKYDLEEEMWDDMKTPASSSSRRASDFYSSPFETSNRRNSHYSSKFYGNSHYNYWEDSGRNYHNSYPRW